MKSTANRKIADQSVAVLMAEHNRLSSLYQQNAELGEKYITTYLTSMSLIIALLVGLNRLGGNPLETLALSLALTMVLFAIGSIVFHRLVDRRIRMIEYLRAINRIHHYFASKDKELSLYFYWGAYDDHPPLHVEGTFLGGLRNIVAIMNSFSMGISIYLLIRLIWPSISLLFSIFGGLISLLATLLFLAIYDKWLMQKADKILKRFIEYPNPILEASGKKNNATL